jgi:hypothetical protein
MSFFEKEPPRTTDTRGHGSSDPLSGVAAAIPGMSHQTHLAFVAALMNESYQAPTSDVAALLVSEANIHASLAIYKKMCEAEEKR